jgi:hypothetical protein
MSLADIVLPPSGDDFSTVNRRNLLESTRDNIAIPPRNGQNGYAYNGNRLISIPVPPGNNYLDMKYTHILATVTTTGNVGDQRRAGAVGLMSYVRRFTFKVQGGRNMQKVDNINLVTSILALFYSEEWKSGVGRKYGYGSDLDRMGDALFTDGTTSGKRMELDLIAVGVLQTGRVLINSAVGWEMEIELEDPVIAMVASVSGANYAWNNVQMYCELVTGTELLDQDVQAKWATNEPITIPFEDHYYFPQVLNIGEALSQKNFSIAADQVITYLCRFLLTSDMSNQLRDPFKLGVNPGVNFAQLQVGGQLIPPSRVEMSGSGAEFQNQIHAALFRAEVPQSSKIDGDSFYSNPPILGVPVASSQFLIGFPLGGGRDAGLEAGLNFNIGNSQAYLRLQLLTGLTLSVHMVQVVTTIQLMHILPNDAQISG